MTRRAAAGTGLADWSSSLRIYIGLLLRGFLGRYRGRELRTLGRKLPDLAELDLNRDVRTVRLKELVSERRCRSIGRSTLHQGDQTRAEQGLQNCCRVDEEDALFLLDAEKRTRRCGCG